MRLQTTNNSVRSSIEQVLSIELYMPSVAARGLAFVLPYLGGEGGGVNALISVPESVDDLIK